MWHNSHPKAVTQIAIDMSPAYLKGVVQAIEEVRRKEARQNVEAKQQLERSSGCGSRIPNPGLLAIKLDGSN